MLSRYFPFLSWLPAYRRHDFPGDLVAGVTVASMLVPQGMAYALLAGLPPIVGLYTGILPVLIYGLLGTSPVLTMGPTAITSVLVLGSLQLIAPPGTPQYVALAATLALQVGLLYLVGGVLRLGWTVNFLSRPVIAGYMNAAAIIITASQWQHLLGVSIPRTDSPFLLIFLPIINIADVNMPTVLLSVASIALLLYFRHGLPQQLRRHRLARRPMLVFYITRSGPLAVIVLSTLAVRGLGLHTDVAIVGDIPAGFPALQVPGLAAEYAPTLLLGAVSIAFVGFMEGISTAKTLASRQRQQVDANQELFAMGLANIAAAFSGGYATTTSISRSAVNHAAGARTGLSSVIAAIIVAGVVMYFTEAFVFVPRAALAAIILVSVINLLDAKTPRQLWRYSRAEAIILVITFLVVLMVNIGVGIATGLVVSSLLHLWRTSRPNIVTLGQVGDTNIYRDASRHDVRIVPHIIILRMDESLYFANIQYLEDVMRQRIAKRPEANTLVLSFESINRIDSSALQTLEDMVLEFASIDIYVCFAELKDRTFSSLVHVCFVERVGAERFFKTVHQAVLTVEDAPNFKVEEPDVQRL